MNSSQHIHLDVRRAGLGIRWCVDTHTVLRQDVDLAQRERGPRDVARHALELRRLVGVGDLPPVHREPRRRPAEQPLVEGPAQAVCFPQSREHEPPTVFSVAGRTDRVEVGLEKREKCAVLRHDPLGDGGMHVRVEVRGPTVPAEIQRQTGHFSTRQSPLEGSPARMSTVPCTMHGPLRPNARLFHVPAWGARAG